MMNLLRGKSSKNTRLGEYRAMPLEKNMVLMQNECVVGADYINSSVMIISLKITLILITLLNLNNRLLIRI